VITTKANGIADSQSRDRQLGTKYASNANSIIPSPHGPTEPHKCLHCGVKNSMGYIVDIPIKPEFPNSIKHQIWLLTHFKNIVAAARNLLPDSPVPQQYLASA